LSFRERRVGAVEKGKAASECQQADFVSGDVEEEPKDNEGKGGGAHEFELC